MPYPVDLAREGLWSFDGAPVTRRKRAFIRLYGSSGERSSCLAVRLGLYQSIN